MRKTRNPRYAPEALERRLSPSGLIAPVSAQVLVLSGVGVDDVPPTDPNDPTDPYPIPPDDPRGPWTPY